MPATWSTRRVVVEASVSGNSEGRVGWAGEATPRGRRGSPQGDDVLLASPASLVLVPLEDSHSHGGKEGAREAMEAVAARWFDRQHVAEALIVPPAVAALAAAGRATGIAITGSADAAFLAAVVDQQLVFRSEALVAGDAGAVAAAVRHAAAALDGAAARPLAVVNAAAASIVLPPGDGLHDVAFPHGADAPWIGASILASLPHAPRSSGAPSRALASVFLTKAMYLANGRRAVPEPGHAAP